MKLVKTPRRGRRNFVKLGGLLSLGTLGLPLLDASRAAAQTEHPLRLILMFTPNGTIQEEFWPTPGASESEFELSTITKPLEPFKDRLLFLKGLEISVVQTGPGGPHQKGMGGLFTGRELQTGNFVDGDGARSGWANGISVDQEIAARVGDEVFLRSLELGVRATEADVRGRISYSGPAAPMPPINSPLATFERLFSGFGQISDELKARRRSVIDTLQAQYGDLTPRLGATDQQKIEQHFELMRQIERRLNITPPAQCVSPEMPAAMAADDELTMPEVSRLQMELLAAGLACDLTRVASVQFCSAINEIRYPWLDDVGEGHTLSHAGPSNTEARNALVGRHVWHAEQLAALMTALDAVPEGEGTALDNSLILWGNELGLGDAHTHSNIPFVVAGGVQGKFKMGRFLQYGAVSHSSLLLSLMHAMGLPDETFGHPDFAAGPLEDLS